MKKETINGFTFVELLAVVVLLGIISSVAMISVSKYRKKAEIEVYKTYEKNMKEAAKSYLLYNTSIIPNQGGTIELDSDTLVTENYLDDMADPDKSRGNCLGSVYITNNASSQSTVDNYQVGPDGSITWNSSNTNNLDLKYEVCLICRNYKSSSCK